jgi:GNAT acetyltransferase-like protein
MSAQLCILSRAAVNRGRWDEFVEASDEAWLWHRFEFQDLLATWPGRSDLSFAVCEAGDSSRVLAAIPLHSVEVRRARVLPWVTFESLGGPALGVGAGVKERQRIYERIREHLLEIAGQAGAVQIDLGLAPLAPAFRGERCPRVNPLLVLGGENSLTQTVVADLRHSEAALRAAYSKTTRWELRRIEQENLRIREAAGETDLQTYYQLHRETYERTGAHPHPIEYFRGIFQRFVPRGWSRILFLERDGQVVAAQNTAIHKRAALYWTGASRTEKLGGENKLLLDRQIHHARLAGCEWYEIGEAFPNASGGKLKGLSDFKRSLGGELYPLYRTRIVTRQKAYALSSSLRGLRE